MRPDPDKRIHTILRLVLVTICVGSLGACAGPKFSQSGNAVTVQTDRYRVVVDALEITRIENKLTGEVYAAPPEKPAPPSQGMRVVTSVRGVAVESVRPNVPVKYYHIGPHTLITCKISGDNATMTYRGLESGEGAQAELAPAMTITLRLAVEPKTGDLLITPEVKGNIERAAGVQDRGILSNTFHVTNLASNLRVIVPLGEGVQYKVGPESPLFTDWPSRSGWPMFWTAGLAIAESDKGCVSIWADEPTLKYGRYFTPYRSGGLWNFGFDYETTDVIYKCDEIKDATWRFNVFKGYWVNAAARYVEQMKRDGMKTLEERTPAWAAKVRIELGSSVINPDSAKAFAALVPPDTMTSFTSQGWLKGWGTPASPEYGFPNYPPGNAVQYEAGDGIAKMFKIAEDLHIHVFPYTNATCVSPEIPWIRQKLNGHQMLAWKIWQRMYPELCLDIVKRYGVSAIYDDCSWSMARSPDGAPDGDNWFQGSAHMREYFHQLMPEIAEMGERNNEVTARGQQFALGWVPANDGSMHPICGYLFNPFVRMWNLAQSTQTFDADDIRGFLMTRWNEWYTPHPMQADLMIRKRGVVFAQEQLVDYWPPRWDPSVMHYFKGKDGTEYRFVHDRGTRFVKVKADGSFETIYWRLKGVREAVAPGSGIEGWIGYDGDKIVGLNPNVPLYVTVPGAARPPAVITSVPDSYVIHRNVIRDGYWLATLVPADQLKVVPKPDAKEGPVTRQTRVVHVRSTKPLRFVGVESAKEVSPGEYEVQVALPGGFGAAWSDPTAVKSIQSVEALPAAATANDQFSGVVCYIVPSVNLYSFPVGNNTATEDITAAWYLTLPREPVRLAFTYGAEHGYGDGANYMVRVNGRELWKEYHNQTSSNPEEAKIHKAPPFGVGSIDLSAYAGQNIILELACNGQYSGGSETMRWTQTRLEPIKP